MEAAGQKVLDAHAKGELVVAADDRLISLMHDENLRLFDGALTLPTLANPCDTCDHIPRRIGKSIVVVVHAIAVADACVATTSHVVVTFVADWYCSQGVIRGAIAYL